MDHNEVSKSSAVQAKLATQMWSAKHRRFETEAWPLSTQIIDSGSKTSNVPVSLHSERAITGAEPASLVSNNVASDQIWFTQAPLPPIRGRRTLSSRSTIRSTIVQEFPGQLLSKPREPQVIRARYSTRSSSSPFRQPLRFFETMFQA
jgi:hypothetical protein